MRKTCLVLLAICLQANDIRISEVMSNPQGSEYENEFIEVFNASDHVIQINGWILSDGNGVDTISHLSGPTSLQPFHYALIMDPGYDYLSGPYSDLLNDTLPIYTISTDGSFGSGGLSNSGESVLIQSPDSSISSEMSWVSATQNGFSWERVSVNSEDSQSVWQQSLEINGTPGYRNSVTPPLINLSIIGVSVESSRDGEPVEILLGIKNDGENQVADFSISIYRDDNQNGEKNYGEWEIITSVNVEVDPQEVIEYPLHLFPLIPGVHELEASVLAANDEIAEDDSLRFEVIGSYPQNCISVTEVMYSPSSDQQGEWIEIQNRSEGDVSLQGWTFSDATQTRHKISDTIMVVRQNEYLTLCSSSSMANYFGLELEQIYCLDSWPALNSSSDSVRLFDANGHEVTTVFYRGSWGESGSSLERRHPDIYPHGEINWAASTQEDGGTPSQMNTRHLLPIEIKVNEINVDIPTVVGPTQAEVMVGFQNMGMDTLHILELDSDADIYWYGSLSSFGFDSLTFTSPMLWAGYNEIPIRILYDDQVLVDTSIVVVLGFPPDQIAINEIHYIPHEDQVEFLEFVNTSSSELDLRGWSYRDRSGAEGAVVSQLIIQPDSLFLWTGNALKLSDWAPPSASILQLSTWPSLNNSSDSIFILDPLGRRMITLGYESPPEAESGKSLERLALWKAQDLESSWSVCQDPRGITPGLENSLFLPPRNLAVQELTFLDSILWVDIPFSVRIAVMNTGINLVESALLNARLFHDGLTVGDWSWNVVDLHGGDAITRDVDLFSETSGWVTLEVTVHDDGDETSNDNIISQQIYLSEEGSGPILNEVMPLPVVGQDEWIEMYNGSENPIDLRGWVLTDNSGVTASLSDTSLLLAGRHYLVFGPDDAKGQESHDGGYQYIQHFPTLNNTEERLKLYDPQGIPMDGMSYDNFTGLVTGRSLERIRFHVSGEDPGNWSVCVNDFGSTPGEENSLHLDALGSILDVELNPNPFSPNGDGKDDQLVIRYELPFERGLMSVMVFDMAGRQIACPVQVKPISHRGQVWWDGEANYGGKAVTGLYIMKLLFDDQAGKVWSCLKKVYLIR
ncbi:MAG: lamin tail domain-containing protein [Candidatus Marinimicrobia bacterium]|nr:lamin tail domain-containing protein [Candidatus Neomarinimicrobiota bacterium]